MYTYKQVCSMITSRLIQQLDMAEPYFLRDEYIAASRRKGSNLYNSELEELWLIMVAEEFDDKVLRALIETRTQMSWAKYKHGFEQTKTA